MINFKSIIKNYIKDKKYLKIIKVLKKLIEATIIIKYILNLGVNLIIDKLLTLALVIKK